MAKGRKTGGRRAGTPNKIGAEVRAAILDAFVQVGGSSGSLWGPGSSVASFGQLPARSRLQMSAFCLSSPQVARNLC